MREAEPSLEEAGLCPCAFVPSTSTASPPSVTHLPGMADLMLPPARG